MEEKIVQAQQYYDLGMHAMIEGDVDKAMGLFQMSCPIWRELSAAAPLNRRYWEGLGAGELQCARMLCTQGHHDAALGSYYASLGIHYRVLVMGGSEIVAVVGMAYCHEGIGKVLSELSDREGALANFRSAVQIWRRVGKAAETGYFHAESLVRCLVAASSILRDLKQVTEAVVLLEEAHTWQKTRVNEALPDRLEGRLLASISHDLGDLLREAGRTTAALECYKSSITLYRSLVDDGLLGRLRAVLGDMADALCDHHDLPSALTYQLQEVEVQQQVLARDPGSSSKCADLAFAHDSVGYIRASMKDLKGALKSCKQAVALLQAAMKDPSRPSLWHYALALCQCRLKELEARLREE